MNDSTYTIVASSEDSVTIEVSTPTANSTDPTEKESVNSVPAKIPHVYTGVDQLEGTEKVGSKHCVALIQKYVSAPATSTWEEGEIVLGSSSLAKGTAIATFVNGLYESKRTGNHAAFYISQDSAGITIMDQWVSDTSKPKVSSRYLRKKGKNADGAFVDPSNNAEAYSVILW